MTFSPRVILTCAQHILFEVPYINGPYFSIMCSTGSPERTIRKPNILWGSWIPSESLLNCLTCLSISSISFLQSGKKLIFFKCWKHEKRLKLWLQRFSSSENHRPSRSQLLQCGRCSGPHRSRWPEWRWCEYFVPFWSFLISTFQQWAGTTWPHSL